MAALWPWEYHLFFVICALLRSVLPNHLFIVILSVHSAAVQFCRRCRPLHAHQRHLLLFSLHTFLAAEKAYSTRFRILAPHSTIDGERYVARWSSPSHGLQLCMMYAFHLVNPGHRIQAILQFCRKAISFSARHHMPMVKVTYTYVIPVDGVLSAPCLPRRRLERFLRIGKLTELF